MRVLRLVFLLGLLPAAALGQVYGAHASPEMIADVTQRFNQSKKAGGMFQVAIDVQRCYDGNFDYPQALAACMLWDMAAMRVDANFRLMTVSRGLNDPGPLTGFFGEKAWSARMSIYHHLAFGRGSSPTLVSTYFNNAIEKVVNGVHE